MKSKIIFRILVAAALVVFFCLCYYRLALPYFWDEMAAYTKVAYHLYVHGISLLPSAAPPDFSFGHPLIAPAICAVFYKIFGPTVFVTHSVCMGLALLMAWAVYRFGESFFSPLTGFLTFCLFIVQPIFMAQSTQLLLEMPFALFTIWSVYYFLKEKWWLFALFATLAILTKETGLVLPIAFAVIYFYKCVLNKNFLTKKAFTIAIPYLIFGIFLLLQKKAYGWYFSTVNMDKTTQDWESFKQRLDYCFDFLINQQGRIFWILVIIIALIIIILKHLKNLSFLKSRNFWLRPSVICHLTIAVYAFGFLVFSSINNPLERYLLVLFPFFCLWIVLLIKGIYGKPAFSIACIVSLIFVGLNNMENGIRYTDVDLGYIHHVKTQQQICNYIQNDSFKGKYIYTDWPTVFYASSTEAGYVKKVDYELKIATDSIIPKADYYIYTMPGNLSSHEPLKGLVLLKTFESSYAKASIYKVVK